jgi:hypothetical protein
VDCFDINGCQLHWMVGPMKAIHLYEKTSRNVNAKAYVCAAETDIRKTFARVREQLGIKPATRRATITPIKGARNG